MPEIEPFFDGNGQGIYDRVIREIIQRSEVDMKISYFPFARAILQFSRDKNSCYIASEKIAESTLGGDFIEASEVINRNLIIFATAASQPELRDLSRLRNKNVAALIGEPIANYALDDLELNFQLVVTHEQSVNMLEAGRVDAILGSMVELIPYSSRLELHADRPVYAHKDTFTCHPGADSEAVLRRLEPAIRAMREDGSLKRLLGDYYLLD